MTTDLTPTTPGALAQAGELVNQITGAGTFSDYRERKAANTLRRQDNDLILFADFLRGIGLTTANRRGYLNQV